MSNRLSNHKVAARYAKALFDSAISASADAKKSEGASSECTKVAEDLAAVNALFASLPALQSYLENPSVAVAEKLDLVNQQIGQSVVPLVGRLLVLLIENQRIAVLPEVVEWFTQYRNEHDHITKAEVVTAVELDDKLKARIQKGLESKFGFKKVELSSRVDPGLLGGVIVKIQDRVIDGSYVGRLEELRKKVLRA